MRVVIGVISLALLTGCADSVEVPAPFASCDAAREAGATLPLTPNSPGWNPKLDRDRDGEACA